MDRWMIGIAAAAALGAAGAGYALGGYATGGSEATASTEAQDRSAFWQDMADARAKADMPPPAQQVSSVSQGPEHYVCHGCGPTLAQRRAQEEWGGGQVDSSHASPQEGYPATGL